MSAELWVTRLETVSYAEALAFQNCLREARESGSIPDLLLLLEHWPVYTKGRRSSSDELPMGEQWYEMQGIEVAETDRGGLVTYHGPGQLVAYPIVDLGPYGDDIHTYVRQLETVMLAALADHRVPAQVFDGLTGVWTAGQPPIPSGEPGPQGTPVGPASKAGEPDSQARKIGSIGVHVSRGVTTHGFAINVNNDLQPFEWIVPCGIEYVRMTSLAREHRAEQDFDAFAETVAARFAEVMGRDREAVGRRGLAERAGAALPAG